MTPFESGKDAAGMLKLLWKENSISKLLKEDDVRRCSFVEIKDLQYATINCADNTSWTTLVDSIFGINGVQSEYVFLDAFCIDHSPNQHGDQKEFMKRRSQIFEHSKEHHIIDPACLYCCETWYDLSFIDPQHRPTVHILADDPEANENLLKAVEEKGFECVGSEPEEAPMKDFVKKSIVSRWETIDKCYHRVRDTVIKAMELQKV